MSRPLWVALVLACATGIGLGEGAINTSPVLTDVVRLHQAKVDDSVILAYVQTAPKTPLDANQILELRDAGISDQVVVALLNGGGANAQPASPAPIAPAPSPDYSAQTPPQYAPMALETPTTIVEAPTVEYIGYNGYPYNDWYWGSGWGLGWGLGFGIGWGWGGYWGCGWGYPSYCYNNPWHGCYGHPWYGHGYGYSGYGHGYANQGHGGGYPPGHPYGSRNGGQPNGHNPSSRPTGGIAHSGGGTAATGGNRTAQWQGARTQSGQWSGTTGTRTRPTLARPGTTTTSVSRATTTHNWSNRAVYPGGTQRMASSGWQGSVSRQAYGGYRGASTSRSFSSSPSWGGGSRSSGFYGGGARAGGSGSSYGGRSSMGGFSGGGGHGGGGFSGHGGGGGGGGGHR
jgi:hypothetical protein